MKILYLRHHFSVEKPTPVGGENPYKLHVIEEENIAEIHENRACEGAFPWCETEQQRHPHNHDERMQHKLDTHVGGVTEGFVF